MDWTRPDVDPNEIAQLYLESVRLIPQSVSVWFRIEGSSIHFYTVLDEKLAAESAVYEAERIVRERYDAALLEFRVYPDKGPIKAFLHELTPLLQPLDALRG